KALPALLCMKLNMLFILKKCMFYFSGLQTGCKIGGIIREKVKTCAFRYAFAFLIALMSAGFIWSMVGLQLAPTNKLYHQLVQALFWFPTLLLLGCRPSLLRLWCSPVPILLLLAALWAAITASFGAAEAGEIKNV